MRRQAKDGTTRFYRVATAYVMVKRLRVTLAVRFVLPDDDTVTLLDDLNRLKTLGIRVARLFLVKPRLKRAGPPRLKWASGGAGARKNLPVGMKFLESVSWRLAIGPPPPVVGGHERGNWDP